MEEGIEAAGASGAPRRLPASLLLGTASLCWAGNWVVGRVIREQVPPMALSFWRWVVCLAVLLPLSWSALRREWPTVRRAWPVLVPLGMLGIGNFAMAMYLGLQFTTATNGVLLHSATPAFIVVISFCVGLGHPTPRQLAGIALSLGGVVAIICHGSPASLLSTTVNHGDLWILAGVVSWAVYTILLARYPVRVEPMVFLTAITVVGLVWIAPFYAWELATGARMQLTLASVASVSYVALPASLVAFVAWNEGVAAIGANRAGVFLYLVPAFGSLLAVGLLGESFRGFHAVGIGLILAGVTLASSARAPR